MQPHTTFSGFHSHSSLFLGALVLCLASCGAESGGTSSVSRPNVLLISVDSLRQDHVSAYGYKTVHAGGEITTPAVDRLAREGVLFENALTSTSWTLPSHMALMTGLEDSLHGVSDNSKRLDPAIGTLAEMLSARGYQTAGFFTGPNLHPIFGFGAGFETYTNASGVALSDELFELAESDKNALATVHRRSHAGLTSPELTDRGLAWLDEHGQGTDPFFLFMHFWDPHYNYDPPDEYRERFDGGYEGPTNAAHFLYSRTIKTPRDMQHILAMYDAEIRYTDDHITRLLDRLDSLGLADNTLVIFVSDHGEEFYEHGKKGHQRNFFDESVQIPLVMRLPGTLPAGTRIEALARIQDILPTICEITDTAAPEHVTGLSLKPLIDGQNEVSRVQSFALELPRRERKMSGVRGDDLLVVWDHAEQRGSFYDLNLDPKELQPHHFDDLETSELEPVKLLRERLADLEELRSKLPVTAGHGGVESLPQGLEDDLRKNGYLGGPETEAEDGE